MIGNIASGKSTYIKKMAGKRICESVLSKNNLLEKSYLSSEFFFMSQLQILNQLYARQDEDFEIFDRDFSETLIFSQVLRDQKKIDDKQFEIFNEVYENYIRAKPLNQRKIIYIRCPAAVCF